jgi:hypothetical protein
LPHRLIRQQSIGIISSGCLSHAVYVYPVRTPKLLSQFIYVFDRRSSDLDRSNLFIPFIGKDPHKSAAKNMQK